MGKYIFTTKALRYKGHKLDYNSRPGALRGMWSVGEILELFKAGIRKKNHHKAIKARKI